MKLSILNLVPIREGQTYKEAVNSMLNLAKFAENLGIERYWIAEHHNMPHIASSATTLLIEHTLSHTNTLRVGSGGVMLPNHSPYVVAEQYATLERLYPGRVELGLGRAPGTDTPTARALRRGRSEVDFRDDLAELRGYFEGTNNVQAYPAKGLNLPFYILGSSLHSAYLAAELGLTYAFASHFAPRDLYDAVEIYRRNFKPSKFLDKPYVIIGVNAYVGDSDEEAMSLATSQTMFFINVVSGGNQNLMPPVKDDEAVWRNYQKATQAPHFGPVDFKNTNLINQERAVVRQMTACSLIGSKESVKFQLQSLAQEVKADEIMAVSYIFDEQKQQRSYALLKEIVDEI
ncbi:LLM class flavin-dependent oxidoreductase [Campylobacter sp. RM9344]|uniref:LLM class flavin-dependent oxidoreductase n=1 Tax=Campylobacter californiensis TaxID=1032243 RepID=A0AAW3ZUP9_9BACT|nr:MULTISPECIES: LLM class flavin-dependent oxidoreductase [unclassified Campylobacter]MBE2985363.1 LLM class flavin-dependent oxidoreductase [Campylobacter sp. RM6883]MBE2995175.1 LLM class flavin-dependent oxidoreductase [Campylobacter sp. RM6913]MBE3029096.1 LLM class flavin-dependent oxidoreductase [Campylobacter sp. RM9344]MBE3607453.1 LLM class flavin-dependent oxidoreductase [Campylobacter sp. RM9337]QCD50010.1 luciferase-like monooxygenase [Campylobacter sp. RM6914]